VHAVLHPERKEGMPRGVELDLVDPLAEPVVGAKRRRVLVREATELEWLAAAEPTERPARLHRPRATLPLERLDERPILGEEVVARERRRLVRGVERGAQIVLNCSNGCRQASQ
jgi:hypothetical protein